jgi:hypothetical protein
LTLGMIVVNIFLPLIAKVSNTLIGFSSLGANRNSYPCGHLFSLDKLSYPPFSYFGPILLLKTAFFKMWLSIKHWIFWEPHILHDMV